MPKRKSALKDQRNKRIRRLVHTLNKLRRQQAKKIDILCNNIVATQKDFIKKLKTLSFVVDFYESITGQTELNILLSNTADCLRQSFCDTNLAVFLLKSDSFQVHTFESDQPTDIDTEQLTGSFSLEVVNNIANANKLCLAEDMFAMGLQGNLKMFSKICIRAVSLCANGSPVGFIMVYRSAQNEFRADELEKITAITPGLTRAIKSSTLTPNPSQSK